MSNRDLMHGVLRLLSSDDDPHFAPAPIPAEEIEACTLNPHQAFGLMRLEDVPGAPGLDQPPEQQDIPKEVEQQVKRAVKQGLASYDAGHKRVPTRFPAEEWTFPQYEGVDMRRNDNLSNLSPGTPYQMQYLLRPERDNPDRNDIWVSMAYAGEKSVQDRLRTNGGLIAVTYTRTSASYILGRGGFGMVYLADGQFMTPDTPADQSKMDPAKHIVIRKLVVKEINFRPKKEHRRYKEGDTQPASKPITDYFFSCPLDFTVAMLCNNHHILKIYDYTSYWYDPGNEAPTKLWIGFLELLKGGDLARWVYRWRDYKFINCELKPAQLDEDYQLTAIDNLARKREQMYAKHGAIPEVVTRGFMQQLYEGIFYLHQLGVAHLDLKPENVMFDEHGTVKVVDLGLSLPIKSVEKEEEWSYTASGTAGYMAPEVMKVFAGDKMDPPEEKVSYKATLADVYSLAVIVFECLYGLCPIPVLRDMQYTVEDGQQVPKKKVNYGKILQLIRVGQDDYKFYWFKTYVHPNRKTNQVSDQAIAFMMANLMEDPDSRTEVYWALAEDNPELDWLAPKTVGIDALHDFRMLHGTIEPDSGSDSDSE